MLIYKNEPYEAPEVCVTQMNCDSVLCDSGNVDVEDLTDGGNFEW